MIAHVNAFLTTPLGAYVMSLVSICAGATLGIFIKKMKGD